MIERAVSEHGSAVQGLAKRFARTTGLRGHEDDLTQEGLIALVKSVRRDPTASWHGYYMGCVLGAMKNYLRTERRKPETEELEDLDMASKELSAFERLGHRETLARVYHLPPRERAAVIGYAMEWSDEEVAAGLGVTSTRVRQLRAQGERRLAS